MWIYNMGIYGLYTYRIGIGYTYLQNRFRLYVYLEQGQAECTFRIKDWLYVHPKQGLDICTFRIGVGYMYIQNRGWLNVHLEQGLAICTFRIGVGYMRIYNRDRLNVHLE